MGSPRLVEPDLDFIRELKGAGGDTLKRCYQCATCSTTCNLSNDASPFPRKEMLMASWGQTEDLMKDPDVWLCYQCNDCSTRCPRGARPGDVLAAVRSAAYKKFAFPSFMGKALASAKALPLLFLIPALVMTALIFLTAPKTAGGILAFTQPGPIDFNDFLPHKTVDAFFVAGNILIFILAAVGFLRFWRLLRSDGAPRKMSVGQAIFLTFKEIFTHSNFRKCDTNHARFIGHFLIFFGFLGGMITTGAVLLLIFLPHYMEAVGMGHPHAMFDLPLTISNPIKILGILSGIALTIGCSILVYRRWTNKDGVGANGYTDTLFLYVLF
ncbi:MAG: quinone-interacting membrane-bound oxidoreductase complex subunit QmoC, partial [Candidatus Krumholzibacteria bacterium]|nr:quinone-interacting membrane-bound oxidoreductase complex subunit QmoC [Candidatus Krumholzibacteria bacterium]